MRTLCTFPGKIGDILWSLPTVRSFAEVGEVSRTEPCPEVLDPVDFVVSDADGVPAVIALLEAQPYISKAWVLKSWEDKPWPNGAQIVPAGPVLPDVQQVDLHYHGWPQLPLAEDIWKNAGWLGKPDLSKPWITPPQPSRKLYPYDVVVGFTDEWAELKAGLVLAMVKAGFEVCLLVPPGGSRLLDEFVGRSEYFGTPAVPQLAWHKLDLCEAAWVIAHSKLFVGCLSALAVLAAGVGKQRVLVEPNQARWNPLFQHWDQPLVMGNDERPTFDARALVAAVGAALEEVR